MTITRTDSYLAERPLLRALAENWWLLLLRGIAAVVFGVLAFVWPGMTLLSLTFLWGGYAIADGIFALGASIAGKGAGAGSRWWLAIVGILGILAGLMAFLWPTVTAQALLVFIAAWAIVTGILEIWGAIMLRKEIENEWLLILSGIVSIIFGVIMFTRPAAGALAVVWMIGIFAIVFGLDNIALAFKLKGHKA